MEVLLAGNFLKQFLFAELISNARISAMNTQVRTMERSERKLSVMLRVPFDCPLSILFMVGESQVDLTMVTNCNKLSMCSSNTNVSSVLFDCEMSFVCLVWTKPVLGVVKIMMSVKRSMFCH